MKVDEMDYDEHDIAIVGMALRFPGASTLEEYWENLRSGVNSISFFDPEELKDLPYSEEFLNQDNVVLAGGLLDDIDRFDAPFFGFSPKEAEITDPQHRLMLETSWHALEHSGHEPGGFDGLVGVFVGSSSGTYILSNLASRPEIISAVGRPRVMMGNTGNFLSTWISYKLNLRGPSLTVQTACSTGLVAVHLAWQSLLNGECDMAIAGATSIAVPQRSCYVYREGGIQSPDGYCRAFDADAKGTVGGNGVGVVVLRRLTDAIAAGDHVHAVIKGSAINNDGSLKVGYTAPSVEGQAAVVAEALAISGCHPETIQYIEAHGTGTPLGDPIEITALTQVFRSKSDKKGFCSIGSVKPNIGHLDTAAGIAGLIKATLAIEHGEMPPTLNFETPNPECRFEDSPFVVNDRLRSWPEGDGPRRAGVSSLGIGGTNAHVVLEEAPRVTPAADPGRPAQLLCLSAMTPEALSDAAGRLAGALETLPESTLPGVAYTLHVGRKSFAHRMALVCREPADALAQLRGETGHPRPRRGHAEERTQGVVFTFPGQGTLSPGMGAELYEHEAAFRGDVDRCREILGSSFDVDLRALLFSADPPEGAAEALRRTEVQQPALFVFEHALARLWEHWGVRPTALLGHSLGEYVAACLAGVFSLEDALRLMVRRGELMAELPEGAMLAVSLSETEIGGFMNGDGDLGLAAINAEKRVVVSGTVAAVGELASALSEAGVASRRLDTDRAFHSPMVEPAMEALRQELSKLDLSEPDLPILSNRTGTWLRPEEATDVEYWCRHMREPVRFAEGLKTVLAERDQVLIEVGPGRGLTSLARHGSEKGNGEVFVCSQPGSGTVGSLDQLLLAAGEAWLAGLELDWDAFYGGCRQRVALPGYPFQHESYWVDARPSAVVDAALGRAAREVATVAPAGNGAESDAPVGGTGDRRRCIVARLREIVHDLTGADASGIGTGTTFFELGVDSLLLIQASEQIENVFGLAVPFRALFEELATLDALADYLDRELPEGEMEPEPAPPPAAASAAPIPGPPDGAAAAAPVITGSPAERVMGRQIDALQQLFSQQLEVLGGRPSESTQASRPAPPRVEADGSNGGDREIGPYRPVQAGDRGGGLDGRQREHLDELIERYTRRTAGSRELTERYRPVLADNRASVGFRHVWKELTYPIVAERSAGATMWDVDGNEYVDVTMGFGVDLFGHTPDFVRRAIEEQMAKGIHVGPQSDMAGEVAERLCRMVGLERAIFTNSGTEAVMTAIRLARTVTGRRKIAMFVGSYHGFYDGTLGRTLDPEHPERTVPVAPGIPEAMVDDLLVFEYGTERSLELLERHADELAAVLVEPVQSRRPDFQPVEFLRRLRELTARHGTQLVFDEMVTGFRSHPGGAQALFGIEADIATYGKAVGGGMPLGVVAGRAAAMDAIDGGAWRFGDDSYPQARQTFFAGTFCKHPLAMSAARAVLRHMEAEGPELQERLNARTEALAGRLNDWFDAQGHPLRIDRFASLFRFTAERPWRDAEMLRFHLVLRGIYAWEGGTRFLSTAHGDDDVEKVIAAVQGSVESLAAGGFLPWVEAPGARRPVAPATVEGLPLTQGQWQVWVLWRMGDEVSRAYNESVVLDLRGPLDREALREAVQGVSDRHEALRTSFDPEEPVQYVHERMEVPLRIVDLSAAPEGGLEAAVKAETKAEIRHPFDLAVGPCLRALLIVRGEESHALVLVSHHIVTDGQSFGSLIRDVLALYGRAAGIDEHELPEAPSYSRYVTSADEPSAAQLERAESYWLSQLEGVPPYLDLPTDRPRPKVQKYDAERHRRLLPPRLYDDLKAFGSGEGATLFMTLLAALDVLLYELTGRSDVVVGVNATRPLPRGQEGMIGFRLNPIALRSRIDPDSGFRTLLGQVKRNILEGYEHQRYPLHDLIKKLGIRREPARFPLISTVVLNLDRAAPPERLGDLEVRVDSSVAGAKVDIYLSVVEHPEHLELVCDYNSHLFDEPRIARWMETLDGILEVVVAAPERPLRETVGTEEAAGGGFVRLYEPTRYQQMMLAGQRLQPDLPIYRVGSRLDIPTAVDAGRFARALDLLVAGAEALRTVVVERDDAPRLAVREHLPRRHGLVDLSGLPDPDRELRRLIGREVRKPFDLSDRLFHSFLARTSPDEHHWFFDQHHVMTDGQTVAVTWRYLAELYEGLGDGASAAELAAGLDVPRFDRFAEAENEYLGSPEAAESEVYWHQRLAAEVERLEPFGRSPAGSTTATVRERVELGDEVSGGLRALASRPDLFVKTDAVSLYNVTTALLTFVLWRISGAGVVSLGAPLKNRPDEAASALGLFMHILPLRVRVRPNETFVDLVRRVTSGMRGTARHQRYPVANSLADPVYDVEMNFVDLRFRDLDGAPVTWRHLHPGHYNEMMLFEMQGSGEDRPLDVFIEFKRALFDPESRRRVLDLVESVAREVIARPDLPLSEIAERTVPGARELPPADDRAADVPTDRPFFDLFLESVSRVGDKVAVRDTGGVLTYRELSRRARSVAASLVDAGVEPGEVVGVLVPRGSGLLTSLLGCLAAEAVYLPLDPSHPRRRTAGILSSSGARRVIAARSELERLDEVREAMGRELEASVLEECLDRDPDRLLPRPSGRQLAYLLYTSGSTGRPKGVMVEQAGMINHLFAKNRDLGLERWDSVLQSAPQTFDVSIWQFLSLLLAGGEVMVAPEGAMLDPDALTRIVEAWRCAVVEVVPTLLRAVLDRYAARPEGPPAFTDLRHMIATGEALDADLCRRWLELYERIPLWNAYGPTECSDDVTHHRMTAAPERGETRIPIGRAVANVRLDVMAEGPTRMLRGVPGELWAGGVALGRGYLGDPRRTSETFVPAPDGPEPGARSYRTGDLVRCRDDGALEFLGRIDHQVKIRGHRIEPGEVEAALLEHEAVGRALVVPWQPPGRPTALVAYAVAAEGHDLTPDGLRSHLASRVPASMVPAHFVLLDSIPLTPNGKVDRDALPEPDARELESAGYQAPRNEVEEILAEIWGRVLGVEKVGVHDDFFRLGGDSILAIQIVSKATRRGLSFAPLALFESSTVAELAAVADTGRLTQAEQGRVTGKVPLTPIQRWFFSLDVPDVDHWNNAMLLATRERLDPAMLEAAVDRLLEHHDALRLRFRHTVRGWQQVDAAREPGQVFSVSDFSDLDEERYGKRITETAGELQASLDLARGPLLRVALFRAPAGAQDRLFVVIHHLAVDGISWRILLEDLVAAYRQIESGQDVELPPKTVSFKRWATTLAEMAESGSLEGELDHWRDLARLPTAKVPRNREDGDNTLEHAETVGVELSEEETSDLLRLRSLGGGGRIEAVLLASLAAGLSREGVEGSQIVVDLESHGRSALVADLDVSRTVGWFTAVHPVALPLAVLGSELDLAATIDAIHEHLGRVPSGGFGYGVLRYLSDDPEVAEVMSAIQEPEVRFNYLGQVDRVLDATSPFRAAGEPVGSSTSRRGTRSHLIDVNTVVSQGRLRIGWSFSRDIHDREAVRAWAERQRDALSELVRGETSVENDPLDSVAADFGWSDDALHQIAEALEAQR